MLPAETVEASAPISKINLSVYEGTALSHGALNSESLPVTIVNTACSSAGLPNNASAAALTHKQETAEGTLKYPFQPFGAYTLTLERKGKNYKYTGENATEAGSSPTYISRRENRQRMDRHPQNR